MKVRDVVKRLEADGWRFYRHGKGDHQHYRHPTKPGLVTIDGRPGEDMPIGTLKAIWKQAGMRDDQ
jgi:predicted RNA binding protein YcfA (HicA-like mRNA interferase family)